MFLKLEKYVGYNRSDQVLVDKLPLLRRSAGNVDNTIGRGEDYGVSTVLKVSETYSKAGCMSWNTLEIVRMLFQIFQVLVCLFVLGVLTAQWTCWCIEMIETHLKNGTESWADRDIFVDLNLDFMPSNNWKKKQFLMSKLIKIKMTKQAEKGSS